LTRKTIASTVSRLPRRSTDVENYVQVFPSDQNALDIFKGEWSSQLPGAWKELKAGTVPLFEDAGIVWAAEQLGGFSGQHQPQAAQAQ
jgi:hypothetical protein